MCALSALLCFIHVVCSANLLATRCRATAADEQAMLNQLRDRVFEVLVIDTVFANYEVQSLLFAPRRHWLSVSPGCQD